MGASTQSRGWAIVWDSKDQVLAWAARHGDGAVPALVVLMARPASHPNALSIAERVRAMAAVRVLIRQTMRRAASRAAAVARMDRVATMPRPTSQAGGFVSARGSNWTGD